MAAPIERVGDLRIDRERRVVECDFSEKPDAAWRQAIADHERVSPFFNRITVNGARLTAEFGYTEQPVNSLVEAIDRRIASANTRTNRSN